MTDSAIYNFLAARRKFIAAVLGMAGVLTTGGLGLPSQTALVVQAIVAFLTVYGIHEVANDPITKGQHAAP
jgi:uncharacterized membrane protein